MNMHSSIDHPLSADDSVACIRDLLKTTLAIMDELDLPSDIGAHLDLAICRVDSLLASENGGSATIAV